MAIIGPYNHPGSAVVHIGMYIIGATKGAKAVSCKEITPYASFSKVEYINDGFRIVFTVSGSYYVYLMKIFGN